MQDTIQQLWYTWAPNGMETRRGFQVYAASAELMNVNSQRFKSINPFLGYELPMGTAPLAATLENSPSCLAYIEVDGQYYLLHKNFAGSDTSGRIGTYFIHLLADLPAWLTARHAINLWDSPFWRKDRSESSGDFKDVQRYELPTVTTGHLVFGPLAEQALQQPYAELLRRDLPFVIQSFLSFKAEEVSKDQEKSKGRERKSQEPKKKSQERLVIAADAGQVAQLIWGLVHSLPVGMFQELTFSIYETEISKNAPQIVGMCLPAPEARRESANSPDRVFSAEVTQNPHNHLLNCYTGHSSSTRLPQSTNLNEYVSFAARCLSGSAIQQQQLAEIIAIAERLGVSMLDDLLMVYKMSGASSQTLSAGEVSAVLQDFPKTLMFLPLESFQEEVLNHALQDDAWWSSFGKAALEHLWRRRNYTAFPGQKTTLAPALSAFACKVVSKLVDNLLAKQTNQQNFARSRDLLHILAPASENSTPWKQLFASLPSHKNNELWHWSVRLRFLLPNWRYFASEISSEIDPWLSLDWEREQLRELFSADLPQVWLERAIYLLLDASQPVPPMLIPFIEQHQKTFLAIFKVMCTGQDKQGWQAALAFFSSLVEGYSRLKLPALGCFLDSQRIEGEQLHAIWKTARLTEEELLEALKQQLASPDTSESKLELLAQTAPLTDPLRWKLCVDCFSEPRVNESRMRLLLHVFQFDLRNQQPFLRGCLASESISVGKMRLLLDAARLSPSERRMLIYEVLIAPRANLGALLEAGGFSLEEKLDLLIDCLAETGVRPERVRELLLVSQLQPQEKRHVLVQALVFNDSLSIERINALLGAAGEEKIPVLVEGFLDVHVHLARISACLHSNQVSFQDKRKVLQHCLENSSISEEKIVQLLQVAQLDDLDKLFIFRRVPDRLLACSSPGLRQFVEEMIRLHINECIQKGFALDEVGMPKLLLDNRSNYSSSTQELIEDYRLMGEVAQLARKNEPFPLQYNEADFQAIGETIYHYKLANHAGYRQSLYKIMLTTVWERTQRVICLEQLLTGLRQAFEYASRRMLLLELTTYIEKENYTLFPADLLFPYMEVVLHLAQEYEKAGERENYAADCIRAMWAHVEKQQQSIEEMGKKQGWSQEDWNLWGKAYALANTPQKSERNWWHFGFGGSEKKRPTGMKKALPPQLQTPPTRHTGSTDHAAPQNNVAATQQQNREELSRQNGEIRVQEVLERGADAVVGVTSEEERSSPFTEHLPLALPPIRFPASYDIVQIDDQRLREPITYKRVHQYYSIHKRYRAFFIKLLHAEIDAKESKKNPVREEQLKLENTRLEEENSPHKYEHAFKMMQTALIMSELIEVKEDELRYRRSIDSFIRQKRKNLEKLIQEQNQRDLTQSGLDTSQQEQVFSLFLQRLWIVEEGKWNEFFAQPVKLLYQGKAWQIAPKSEG